MPLDLTYLSCTVLTLILQVHSHLHTVCVPRELSHLCASVETCEWDFRKSLSTHQPEKARHAVGNGQRETRPADTSRSLRREVEG